MWLRNDVEFTSDMIGDYVGFVYIITDLTNNKMYVGKKLFESKRTLPPLKGKTRKRKVTKESDWMSYYTVDSVPGGISPTYTITTLSAEPYLSINQRVKFNGSTHQGWSNPGNVFEGIVKTISDPTAGQRTAVITFLGAGGGQTQSTTPLTNGSGGSLNIIDTFVMAQGRII
jgi:hypothetical protein